MADQTPPGPEAPPDNMFPTLTREQQSRIARQGKLRQVGAGETLIEADDNPNKFFVVINGRLNILRTSGDAEEVAAIVPAGGFTGEINMLSGRASEPSEVIEVERENLLALVQTDGELSDILMRAFILRRLELIARGIGNVVLVGSSHSLDTFRIKELYQTRGVSSW